METELTKAKVLILVILEVTLLDLYIVQSERRKTVLILVILEVTLLEILSVFSNLQAHLS